MNKATLSVFALKSEPRVLVAASKTSGQALSHASALEQVARRHGFGSWRAAAAVLPDGQTTGVASAAAQAVGTTDEWARGLAIAEEIKGSKRSGGAYTLTAAREVLERAFGPGTVNPDAESKSAGDGDVQWVLELGNGRKALIEDTGIGGLSTAMVIERPHQIARPGPVQRSATQAWNVWVGDEQDVKELLAKLP